MTEPTIRTPASPRDWWVSLGIAVSAVSAGFSSFAGLKSLAEATGWGGMAPLFALCVDAYALTAIRVWLAGSTASRQARSFAKINAIGAILLSLAGNAAWHLIAAGLLGVTWHVVMAVGAVPPIVLGLCSHLAVLRRQVDAAGTVPLPAVGGTAPQAPNAAPRTEAVLRPMPELASETPAVPPAVPKTVPKPTSARRIPRLNNEDELLAAAQAADAAYRAEHDGRPITRDALRQSLRIGGERATALLRQLRAESAAKRSLSIPQHQNT